MMMAARRQSVRFAFARTALMCSWLRFFIAGGAVAFLIVLAFAILYAFVDVEPLASAFQAPFSRLLLLSVSVTLGREEPATFTASGSVVNLAQRAVVAVLAAGFLGFLIARLGRPTSRMRLEPEVAISPGESTSFPRTLGRVSSLRRESATVAERSLA